MTKKTEGQSIALVWHGEHPELDDIVKKDIKSLRGLRKPEDLMTHSVFLGDSYDGPSVAVWGEVGSDAFHCEYHAKTIWVSLAGLSKKNDKQSSKPSE